MVQHNLVIFNGIYFAVFIFLGEGDADMRRGALVNGQVVFTVIVNDVRQVDGVCAACRRQFFCFLLAA